jgi:isopentenyldiphosphate isomerase
MPELVDIVDNNDVVIGKKTKEEAHAHGLPHRASCIFVFYKGKLLVQRRSLEKNGDLDPSASGHVGAGESYEAAAERELFEELGIRALPIYIGKEWAEHARPGKTKYKHWYALFETEITDEQYAGIKISPREVAELIPMTLEEAAVRVRKNRVEFSGAFVLMLKIYAQDKGIDLGELPLEDPKG